VGIAVIKVVVLGLVCVGGIGAIAAAASKSAPAPTPSIAYPVVAGNKADRLSLVSMQDVQPTVEKVAFAFTTPSELPTSPPPQPQPKEVAKAKAPQFIARHWHDPNDTRASARNPKSEPSRSTSRNGLSGTKLADAQECRVDGLSAMLRKLNLQPACSR
jgi:type IV secretory pathway VirB10-like protein